MESVSPVQIKAFRWFGGKNRRDVQLWLLSQLPTCKVYVEPFGGSAAILLNREPSPIEVFNDIDSGVVNFFRVLREQPDELCRMILLTPFSEEEFVSSLIRTGNALEDARRFYVSAMQAHGSIRKLGGWSRNVHVRKYGMWNDDTEMLLKVAERLRTVHIEHNNAITCIKRYTDPDTLFYIDPPYITDPLKRNKGYYTGEWSVLDDDRLAAVLHQCKGKVAVSGYKGVIGEQLYSDWTTVEGPTYNISVTRTSGSMGNGIMSRQELLFCNYSQVDRESA